MKCVRYLIFSFTLLDVLILKTGQAVASRSGEIKLSSVLNTDKSELDELLKDALMSLKKFMKTGNPKHGIPVLDPLVINKSFNIDNEKFQVKGKFSAEIHNLSNYFINELHVDMNLNTGINVTLSDLTMTGSYDVEGTALKLIPLMGQGNHYLNFTELILSVKPKLDAKDGFLKMTDSGLLFKEQNFEIFIEGLLEGQDVSNLLAYFIRDFFSSLLSRNTKLSQLLNVVIVNSFNMNGKGKNIYDIIETVKAIAAI